MQPEGEGIRDEYVFDWTVIITRRFSVGSGYSTGMVLRTDSIGPPLIVGSPRESTRISRTVRYKSVMLGLAQAAGIQISWSLDTRFQASLTTQYPGRLGCLSAGCHEFVQRHSQEGQ